MIKKSVSRWMAFNASLVRLRQENEAFATAIPAGARVLDAGAGTSPYKDLFDHTKYESADFQQVEKEYAPVTYVCDLANIPVENERFDYVVFNQVMEHLPDPGAVLLELARVLKPGGQMIYTGPLFYEEHEIPYDFYRYTQYGLKHLFENAGFEVVRIDWLEGYLGSVGYQLNRASKHLPYRPVELGGGIAGWLLAPVFLFSKLIFALQSILFHKIELRSKFTEGGFPKNYIAILEKKGK